MASTTEHLREYETIYVLRPDVDADGADRVAQRVSEVVDREKGRLVKFEAWGRRKLAYEVNKQRKGVYVYVKYLGKGGLVHELERNLRLQDVVLKHLTVQVRDDVDATSVTIDPEEVKFRRLELPAEEEEKISREKQLGLVEAEERRERAPREEDEYMAGEDETPESKPNPAGAAGGEEPQA
ncbi:MAG: 30S ribosomal protein S6 [Polyangiales bacterium]